MYPTGHLADGRHGYHFAALSWHVHAERTGRLCAALGSSAASLPERGPGHAVTALGHCPWGGTARTCSHQNISLLSLAWYQNGWGVLVWNTAFPMSCYVFLTMAPMLSPLFFNSLSFFYLITSPCPLPALKVAFLNTGREILWSKKLEWVVKIFLLPAISHSSSQLLCAPLVIFTCRMFFSPFLQLLGKMAFIWLQFWQKINELWALSDSLWLPGGSKIANYFS